MILVVYLILFIVFLGMPKALKLVTIIVNIFIPDSIPFLDEIAMVLGFIA